MRQVYLVHSSTTDFKAFEFKLAPSLSDAVANWTTSTRISPAWVPISAGASRKAASEIESAAARLEASTCHVVVMGLVRSRDLIETVSTFGECWLTLGAMNVVLLATSARHAQRAVDWVVRSGDVSAEWWTGKRGRFEVRQRILSGQPPDKLRDSLVALARRDPGELLRDAHSEFVTLASSAASRSASIWPALLQDIESWVRFVDSELSQVESGSSTRTPFQVLAVLTSLNAGLSRLTSQAFSGIPPVSQTETHWWVHSLFGTGVGNLALWNLTRHLEHGLETIRIPTRLDLTKYVPWSGEHLVQLEPNSPILARSPLVDQVVEQRLKKLDDRDDAIAPVPFYSGRDGFHASEIGISAPLAALTGCTSARWTLKTLTHELLHPIVQAVLDRLGPSFEGLAEPNGADAAHRESLVVQAYSEFAKLYNSKHEDAFTAARGTLLRGLVLMQKGAAPSFDRLTPTSARKCCEDHLSEVEEILVSAIDFLYFYGKPDRYIREVWLTWTAVPAVYDRLREYLLRTVLAVLSHYLKLGGDAVTLAIADVRSELVKLKAQSSIGGEMLDAAAKILRTEEESIAKDAAARIPIARLAMHFLWDEQLGAALMRDEAAGAQPGSNKPSNPWGLDVNVHANALRLVEARTLSPELNSEQGVGMMYALAFQVPKVPSHA